MEPFATGTGRVSAAVSRPARAVAWVSGRILSASYQEPLNWVAWRVFCITFIFKVRSRWLPHQRP
ncbi:hypothetical protein KCP71_21720 [Salmonella enterica subsp. enterica]|nr:hypothetical protein KCP71_21720 [Salmonella enterica subsp. enterica]